MIGNWRTPLPRQPKQPEPPPEPHIWDEVTIDQNSKIQKAAEDTNTLVTELIDGLPPEQQSAFANYKKTREDSGREAKVK